MKAIFVNSLVNPMKPIASVLKEMFPIKKSEAKGTLKILDVFNVITPEDVVEYLEYLEKFSFSFEIFKPLEPEDLVSYLFELLGQPLGLSYLFVTDVPEFIPGKYVDYDNIFLLGLLREIEKRKSANVVILFYVEDEDYSNKLLDMFSSFPFVDEYLKFVIVNGEERLIKMSSC